MFLCSLPCVKAQNSGLKMDVTKVASSGPATPLATFFKNAPRDAKLRPLVKPFVLPQQNYDNTPTSSVPSPSSTSLPDSIDKTDNRDVFDSVDMRREEERLKTFEKWPVTFLSAERLARNGFFYLGHGDEVRCAFCKVEMTRWSENDDPATEHQRWAPQCPFVRKLAGQDECGPRVPTREPPRMPGPVHPCYATEAARLRSFQDWPRCMPQKPEDLAEAGFFYTGQGDKTKCFYCDGGLKDWETDDVPWQQHARWFDRCAYVQLVKGRDYVQKVMSEACTIAASNAEEDVVPEKQTPEPSNASESPEKPVDDSKLCKICYVEERNVCFVPCGHVVACAKCALTADKCPMCRSTFQSAVRLYFS